MWGSVLGVAAMSALNPVRLGLMLFLVTRRRPVQNLFAYWLGCVTVALIWMLGPVIAVNSATNGSVLAESDSRVKVWFGTAVLAITAVFAVRHLVRSRTKVAVAGGPGSASAEQSHHSIPFLQKLDHQHHGARHRLKPSVGERLSAVIRTAWQKGSPWVSYILGLFSLSVEGALFLVAMIVTSGLGLATQIIAVLVCVAIMFAPAEFILISYWTAPRTTLTALRRVHDWAIPRRTAIFLWICALFGASLLVQGLVGI